MKTEEHCSQVRDKFVNKFKVELSYKAISQAVNISKVSV